ncbi:glycosyltransferase [Algoriphagus aestuariicola]|uniref:Glycosyltransferase n=1 Tax=Algoriphagus aestuariicola TaxID=1852016 RepID=A0ABS3BLL4_9BACT|nr:glycosyltransferase [Algoriphagus aestuariicola]MBN7800185.1 glycosyltransferase [Algoriphagus aestuariicola]
MENQTMVKPKLSVCMIAYNVGRFIGDAIDGVLNQKADFNIELVISNDCSSDNTEEVVLKFAQDHPQGNWIKYKRQEKNLGSTLNYLWALDNCTGDFIAICDGDDYWTDAFKVQKQVDFLESHPQYIGSFHNRHKCDINGKIISSSIQKHEKRNWRLDDFISEKPEIPSASVIFRKPLIFKLPMEFQKVVINGDTFLWVYTLKFGDFYFDANIGPSVYRIHPQGLWSSKSSYRKSQLSLNTYQLLDAAFPGRNSVKSQIFNIRFHLFYYAMKEKELAAGLSYYFSNIFGLLAYPRGFKVFLSFHKSIVFKGRR